MPAYGTLGGRRPCEAFMSSAVLPWCGVWCLVICYRAVLVVSSGKTYPIILAAVSSGLQSDPARNPASTGACCRAGTPRKSAAVAATSTSGLRLVPRCACAPQNLGVPPELPLHFCLLVTKTSRSCFLCQLPPAHLFSKKQTNKQNRQNGQSRYGSLVLSPLFFWRLGDGVVGVGEDKVRHGRVELV